MFQIPISGFLSEYFSLEVHVIVKLNFMAIAATAISQLPLFIATTDFSKFVFHCSDSVFSDLGIF